MKHCKATSVMSLVICARIIAATHWVPPPTEKWKFRTNGKVESSPTLSPNGSVIYFGSDDYNLYSLDAFTGKELWVFPTNGSVSSPTLSPNGSVIYFGSYFGSYDHNLYSLDALTGRKLWAFRTNGQVSSPTLSPNGSVIYFGSTDNNLYSLDAFTGRKLWVFPTNGSVSSPTLSPNGSVIYFGSYGYNLYSLDALTGRKLWVFPTNTSVSSPTLSPNGSVIYFGSNDAYNLDVGYAVWTVARLPPTPVPPGGKCGSNCAGHWPSCKCPLSGDGTADSQIGSHISSHATFGFSTTADVSVDCSKLPGCNQENCNACIQQYWTSDPTTCVPDCTPVPPPPPPAALLPVFNKAQLLHSPPCKWQTTGKDTRLYGCGKELQIGTNNTPAEAEARCSKMSSCNAFAYFYPWGPPATPSSVYYYDCATLPPEMKPSKGQQAYWCGPPPPPPPSKCGDNCPGVPPHCLCQFSPDGSNVISSIGSQLFSIVSFGNTRFDNTQVAPDCSKLPGCMKQNCNACIQQYWESDPTACVPECKAAPPPPFVMH